MVLGRGSKNKVYEMMKKTKFSSEKMHKMSNGKMMSDKKKGKKIKSKKMMY